MATSRNKIKLWFDRLLSKSVFKQFAILGIVLIVLFLTSWLFLSLSGCDWHDIKEQNNLPQWLIPLYLLIDSNALNIFYAEGKVHGWALFISSITYVLGLFIFNGMIISILTNAIGLRVERHREGQLHYLKAGHYIIMGYDDMVPSIITHIFEKEKDAYILLLSAAQSEYIREKLKKVFTENQLKQVIINYGHRMSKDYYKAIRLESAAQIYIVGKRDLDSHDAINVECVDSICTYLQQPGITRRPKRITCVFEDLDTYAAFKTSEIFGRVSELGIEFVPYNFYSGWAKQVFVKQCHKDMCQPNGTIRYPAVYGKGITPDDEKYVHLVFVGTTNFAVAFAMEAANVLHFPNFNSKGRKTLISFIDKNADTEQDEFITRNRHLFEIQSHYYQDFSQEATDKDRIIIPPTYFNTDNGYTNGMANDFLDVEFEFIKGDIFSADIQELISKWANDKDSQYLSIFLALAEQRQNFTFGMNMPDSVYQNQIPVFIRQDRSDNFVSNLRLADEAILADKKLNIYFHVVNGTLKSKELGGRYANIYPFGMNESAYSADEKSLDRAKLINYLYETADYSHNRFKGILALDAIPKEKIIEEANSFWSKLSVALKWSNLYNAYTIHIKLASLRAMRGLAPDDHSQDTWPLSEYEADKLARVEHDRWNVEKLLMGYRKPHRDEDKYEEANAPFRSELDRNKTRFIHSDIRPYDKLDGIKNLDKEFSRYIPWIIRMTEG